MKAHELPYFTVVEYLDREIETNTKLEYHDGKIYALAGGTINHGLLCGNGYAEIRKNSLTRNLTVCPSSLSWKFYRNVG